jgi:cytochrome c553
MKALALLIPVALLQALLPRPACAQYGGGCGTSYQGGSFVSYPAGSYHDDRVRDFFFFLLPRPVPVGAATPPATPAAAGGVDVSRVAAILAPACARCHSADKHKGGVTLFNAAGAFAPSVSPRAIVDSVVSDEMPAGGPPLDAAGKALLKQWADGGPTPPATPTKPPASSTDADDAVLQALQDVSRRLGDVEKRLNAPPPVPPATDPRKK